MVKKAMETIETLGLESALERRFAVIGDVSVNDVKWVDGTVKPLMKGGIGDVLMQHAASTSHNAEGDEKRAEEIGLDDFVARVLPETTSLELLFKGEHVGNLMSLTAPIHPEPKQLFRWSNDFAWSYGGNVADSIKERVKKAGGKVEGAVLRVSLSWFNFDDLDLHIHEPAGRGVRGLGDHIFFRNKRGWTGGTLDVDMNAGSGTTREAVENVVWSTKPPDGAYRVVVNNFAQRETSDPGFVIEVESGGKLSHYSYNKVVREQQDIDVATLHVKSGVVERVEVGDPAITAANISQEKWGLKTEQYVKVSAVTLSPNYWGDSAVGNKHTFFVIEGAKNDEPTRGFYNEFLHPRLEPHRKVFEVIGDKTKCAAHRRAALGARVLVHEARVLHRSSPSRQEAASFQCSSRRVKPDTRRRSWPRTSSSTHRATRFASSPREGSCLSSSSGTSRLRSKDDFNLNAVAKAANKAWKDISEESFVETAKTPEHVRRETALEVVKYVIDTKLAEEETAKKRADNKIEKEKLLAILAEKQAGKLSELSEKELQRRIAALSD